MRTEALKAEALLLLTATIWGFAFVAQRAGMEHVGPFIFNAIRFALGGLTLVPFLPKSAGSGRSTGNAFGHSGLRQAAAGGAIAGVALFMGASLQQIGIVYTTAGKAGFITGLYVVIVPILGLALRQNPGLGTWIGALCAAAGLYFLSVDSSLRFAPGDAWVLASAFFWAVHVIIIGKLTVRIDWALLAFMQFTTCAVLSFVAAVLTEEIAAQGIFRAMVPILYGGVLSVGVAYTLQVVAQRKAPPAHAAIILSLETVFAALGGWLILGELLPLRGVFGCGLMLAGMLVSQLTGADPGQRGA